MSDINFYGKYLGQPQARLNRRQLDSGHYKAIPKNMMERFDFKGTGEGGDGLTVPIQPAVEATDTTPAIPEVNPILPLMEVRTNMVPAYIASKIRSSGLGAGVILDVGIARHYEGQIEGMEKLFADGHDLSSVGDLPMFSAVPTDKIGAPLWELLGLDCDPSLDVCVIATIRGAAPAAGSLYFEGSFWGL